MRRKLHTRMLFLKTNTQTLLKQKKQKKDLRNDLRNGLRNELENGLNSYLKMV